MREVRGEGFATEDTGGTERRKGKRESSERGGLKFLLYSVWNPWMILRLRFGLIAAMHQLRC